MDGALLRWHLQVVCSRAQELDHIDLELLVVLEQKSMGGVGVDLEPGVGQRSHRVSYVRGLGGRPKSVRFAFMALVGRDQDVGDLLGCPGRVVLLAGDSGVGKSEVLHVSEERSSSTVAPPPVGLRSAPGAFQRGLVDALGAAVAEATHDRTTAERVGNLLVAAAGRVVDVRLKRSCLRALDGTPHVGRGHPSLKGTHPFTVEAIRVMLWDLPEARRNEILATRAATLYGFDLTVLQAVADRVGPTLDELATPLAPEDYPVYPDQTRCTIFNTGLARLATTR